MQNLLDGIKKVSRGELDEQIASFKVYKASTVISVFVRTVICKILKLFSLFLKLFGIVIMVPDRPRISAIAQRKMEEMRLVDDTYREKVLRCQLRWYIFKSKILVFPFFKNDDQLSALVTKSVISLFGKRDLYGLAVTEINDYIYVNYHSKCKIKRST